MYWVKTKLVRETPAWYSGSLDKPSKVVELVNKHLDLETADKEHLVGLYLNQKLQLHAAQVLHIGTINSIPAAPFEVLKPAFLSNSNHIILVHNHPSGDPEPGYEDRELTEKCAVAAKMFDIEIVDHIIIGYKSYFSFSGNKKFDL
jgi:DNA repair protein RadC